ncbi:Asp-tRNA(Asn)/Glu-tRNA(Gln) amidotransferase subunit GatB [Patescibacteria group bacterium]|nr:Asp-tRNA(Asn)/Glu-tRNA(Gln) amidotransferase subunit GatB [Patescibacteria group bacterium]
MKYQPIIGLEVHVELATQSKMFCGCSAEHFGVEPNTHTCPVCLGLPGALPVPNKKAVEWTIMLAQALGCKINLESHFDRKNYFYPDLPKGYQITQYEKPFGEWGKAGNIRIRRVHLEEDTGKLQHTDGMTLVDFNRSGVPLVEIVTEPDFRSIEEVDEYLKKLQKIIRYLGISNADMEKGSMRLEPSISMSPDGKLPNYRVELKNINSFRFARKALEYEIKRQTELMEKGEKVPQQTRGWNEAKNATVPQREKEEAHDYRYFPEPDIPEVKFKIEDIKKIEEKIPELPDAKFERFKKEYGLNNYDAIQLTEEKATADFFEEAVRVMGEMRDIGEISTKEVANWIINKKVDMAQMVPAQLVQKIAQVKVVAAVDTAELEKIINEIISQNSKAVADYKTGKTQVLGFLIGQARTKIKADINVISDLLRRKLS